MRNRKAAERDQLIYEFGILLAPLGDLCRDGAPATPAAFRVALAKIQAGDSAWRSTVRSFTTFAPDIVFNHEYQDISHVPERLWSRVKSYLEDPNLLADPSAMKERVCRDLTAARESFFTLVERVPVEWEPVTFDANTPFTSYLRIRDAFALVRRRVHYFDRYLKPDFFSLFLQNVPRSSEVRLVTTASGVNAVRALSELARQEFADYRLLEIEPAAMHDRNLRIDGQVFSLGPGVDRAGTALTNFGPGDSTATSHAMFDDLIARSRVVHQS